MKFDLRPTPALPVFQGTWQVCGAEVTLKTLQDIYLWSLAIPYQRQDDFDAFLGDAFGLQRPVPGTSHSEENCTLLGLASDQFFLVSTGAQSPMANSILEQAAGRAYLTDQSDAWAHIEIKGAAVRTVLERLCPLNLHHDAFALGHVARTGMEHMNALIWRTGQDCFHLMSARSSAPSFLHALKTSLDNTTDL